jgi:1-deoxy-D-xylulose-5-phosphate synthase
MMKEFPRRTYDVGIAEQHAVTFSAGLAAGGMLPFCNIYSTFMQRAYDSIIHDVALQNLKVVFCLDRGGIVGEDGATHHGVFDLAYLCCIPNMVVAAPSNELQLRNLMYTALATGVPFAIRYPRGYGMGTKWRDCEFELQPIGKGLTLREGENVAVLAIGKTVSFALEAAERAAAEGVSAAVYDLVYAKPLDEQLILEVGKRFSRVITVEDGVLRGGVGQAITKILADRGLHPQITSLGIDDKFIEQGTTAELYSLLGYDTEGILRAILKKI